MTRRLEGIRDYSGSAAHGVLILFPGLVIAYLTVAVPFSAWPPSPGGVA